MLPGPRQRWSRPWERDLLVPLTGSKEGSTGLVALQVGPSPILAFYTKQVIPMGSTKAFGDTIKDGKNKAAISQIYEHSQAFKKALLPNRLIRAGFFRD